MSLRVPVVSEEGDVCLWFRLCYTGYTGNLQKKIYELGVCRLDKRTFLSGVATGGLDGALHRGFKLRGPSEPDQHIN